MHVKGRKMSLEIHPRAAEQQKPNQHISSPMLAKALKKPEAILQSQVHSQLVGIHLQQNNSLPSVLHCHLLRNVTGIKKD